MEFVILMDTSFKLPYILLCTIQWSHILTSTYTSSTETFWALTFSKSYLHLIVFQASYIGGYWCFETGAWKKQEKDSWLYLFLLLNAQPHFSSRCSKERLSIPQLLVPITVIPTTVTRWISCGTIHALFNHRELCYPQ